MKIGDKVRIIDLIEESEVKVLKKYIGRIGIVEKMNKHGEYPIIVYFSTEGDFFSFRKEEVMLLSLMETE